MISASSFLQNPEPSVDFDTVANVKQQHEVNVGKHLIQNLQHFPFDETINLANE